MSDNEDNKTGGVPIFDGKTNNRNTRQRALELIKSYIEEKGWGDALEFKADDFKNEEDKQAFEKKDRRAKGFLLRHTDKSPYLVIKNLKTAKEM